MRNKLKHVTFPIFLLFTFCFLLSAFGLSAQDTWVKTYQPFYNPNGENDYFVEDVLVCDDGGYAVNGYYWYFDDWTEKQWGYLLKTDSNGDFLWTKKDTVSWIDATESAAFVQTDDGGFLSAVYSLWGGTALIKRDVDGNREWVVDGQDLYVRSMDKTNDGNIILAGRMFGLPAIRKITQDTDIFWTKVYQYNDETDGALNSICSASDNGYLATGYVDKYNTGEIDVFVVKTNENGDSLWTKTFDGYNQFDEGFCIIEVNNSNILVSTVLEYQFYIPFYIEMTSEGDTVWTKEFNSNPEMSARSLIEKINEGYILYGYKLSKLNYSQEIIWSINLPGYGAGGDKCFNKLDNGYLCARKIEINWDDYIGLIKTDSTGNVNSIEDNGNLFLKNTELFISPNPFNQSSTISFNLIKPAEAEIIIYNVKGQRIKTLLNNFINRGKYKLTWNGTNNEGKKVSSGLYFIILKNNNKIIQTKKITLIKQGG